MKRTRYFIFAAFAAIFMTSCTVEDELVNITVKDDITTTTTWESGKVYVISGSIGVDNTTLTIEPGTRIEFEAGASLHIGYSGNATLIANGTADKPIVFTSTATSPAAGAWEGITFWGNSLSSTMKYCTIKYGGTSSKGAINVLGSNITFSNNTIQNALSYGITLDANSGFTEMNNNTIEDCGNHLIEIYAGYVHTIGTGNTFTCPDGKGININPDNVEGVITWRKLSKPYYVEGEINLYNATLTIEPGAIFKFDNNGEFNVGYSNNCTLIANGTSTDKIVFTSSATSPTAGAWYGLVFWSNNLSTSSMTYCEIAYAGKSSNSAVKLIGTSLTFSNNSVHHSGGKGLELDNSSFVAMANNTIENVATHAMEIPAEAIKSIGTGNTFTCAAGYGIDINDGDVTVTATWKKQTVPYFANLGININANLTIGEGVTIKFGSSGTVDVGYSENAVLSANGTATSPVVFTSSATTPAAGAWEGIYLWDNSDNTVFNYCEFQYAGKGTSSTRAAIKSYGSIFTVSNSKFKNSSGWGVYYDSYSTFTNTNNTFESCALGNVGFD